MSAAPDLAYPPPAIQLFASLAGFHEDRLIRVNETLERSGSLTVTSSVKLTYNLTGDDLEDLRARSARTIPVPVFRISRNEFAHNLLVMGSDGLELPVLDARSTMDLLSFTLEGVVAATLPRKAGQGDPEHQREIEKLISGLDGLLEDAEHGHSSSRVKEIFTSLVNPLPMPGRTRVENFMRIALHFRMIVVEAPIPFGEFLFVSYQRNRFFTADPAKRINGGWRTRSQIQAPISAARYGRSYHLRVKSDPDMFLDRFQIVDVTNGTTVLETDPSDKQSALFWHNRSASEPSAICPPDCADGDSLLPAGMFAPLGAPYAHLYLHDVSKAPELKYDELHVKASFNEVPPGLTGAISLISGLTAVLIILFALNPPEKLEPEFVAILITAPIAVSGLLGVTPSLLWKVSRVQQGSLFGAWLFGFLAAVAFVVKESPVRRTFEGREFAINEWALAVGLMAGACAVIATASLVRRFLRYRRLVNR